MSDSTTTADSFDNRNQIGAGQEETAHARGGLTATAFGLSDIGCQRSVNQDTLGNRLSQFPTQLHDRGLLYAIADGMGGHAHGEIASALAIDELFTRFYQIDPSLPPQTALTQVMQELNAAVHQAGRDAGGGSMGTTLTIVLLRDNILYVGNIGDSRTYLIRGGKIKQLSQDHSLIGEQIRSGTLTEADARTSAIRNVITRAVGYRETVEPETFAFTVHPGDILLLCSDGLHGLVENEELAQILSTQTLSDATTNLIALARERGGPDNITALVVRVDQLGAAGTANATQQITASDSDAADDATKPMPMIAPDRTEEILLPATENEEQAATTLPMITTPKAAPNAPRPTVAPASMPAPAPTVADLARPAARPPLWLFIVIPLLLIGLIAAGVLLFTRNLNTTPTPPAVVTVVATATVAPAPSATAAVATAPVVAAGSIAPTAQPTATLPPKTPPASAPAQSSGGSNPAAPIVPRPNTPSAIAAGNSGATQRIKVSGTVRFAETLAIPAGFPNDWAVLLYAQRDFQQQQQAAPIKAQSALTVLPFREEYGFVLDLELATGNQQGELFTIQLQDLENDQIAVLDPGEIRIDRTGRPITVRVTSITEQPEPRPSGNVSPRTPAIFLTDDKIQRAVAVFLQQVRR